MKKGPAPWRTGHRKDRVLAGGNRVPPWNTAPRKEAVPGSSEPRPPWRTGSHEDRILAGGNRVPPWNTALITGASSGIGEALARNLAARGVHVILAARRLKLLKKIAMEIHSSGGKATAVRLDVAQAEATAKAIAALDRKFGGIDLVIANAGVGVRTDAPRAQRTPGASVPIGVRTDAPRAQRTPGASVPIGVRTAAHPVPRTLGTSVSVGIKTIPSYSWEAVKKVADINYTGALATLTTLLPAMVARKSGHVVAISSLAGYSALPDAAGYSSPKAGLSRFMECLALDLQNTGVAVTTVHVGFVATPMVAKSTIPLPFLLSAEKAADYMVRGFIKRKREINFPKAMVVLVKILAAMPFWLKKLAARRYWVSHRP